MTESERTVQESLLCDQITCTFAGYVNDLSPECHECQEIAEQWLCLKVENFKFIVYKIDGVC
jgi:hypothetical protein